MLSSFLQLPIAFMDDPAVDQVMTDLRAGSDTSKPTKWKAWGLRPIVLFAAAYMIVGIIHELTHALTAYALRVPSTLFHFAAYIVLLLSLPMPSAFAYARMAESSFWIAAAVGTLTSRKHPTAGKRRLELGWGDIALLLAAASLVRLMVGGITLAP